MTNQTGVIAQELFILNWCKKDTCFDALNTDFHEEFYRRFGGSRHECFWGAQTVYKAMRLAERMYKEGKLERCRTGLGNNWQPGFPKWVWVYSIPEEHQ